MLAAQEMIKNEHERINVESLPTHDFRSSGEEHNRAQFIYLPRELRDIIFEYLVSESRKAPENPDHAGERYPCSPTTPGAIVYESKSPKPALLQLKLCSTQLYEEVHEILRRFVKSDSGAAHLDSKYERQRLNKKDSS